MNIQGTVECYIKIKVSSKALKEIQQRYNQLTAEDLIAICINPIVKENKIIAVLSIQNEYEELIKQYTYEEERKLYDYLLNFINNL